MSSSGMGLNQSLVRATHKSSIRLTSRVAFLLVRMTSPASRRSRALFQPNYQVLAACAQSWRSAGSARLTRCRKTPASWAHGSSPASGRSSRRVDARTTGGLPVDVPVDGRPRWRRLRTRTSRTRKVLPQHRAARLASPRAPGTACAAAPPPAPGHLHPPTLPSTVGVDGSLTLLTCVRSWCVA